MKATRTPPSPAPFDSQIGPRGSSAPDRRRVYRQRARIADLLVTMVWSSGAIAAALFLASGGAAKFGTVADTVTSIGVLAGLIGTDFILVMLVLAARVPLIDQVIGHDRAIAVHRSLGKPALYLLLGHGVLLLIGYGMSSGINPIAEIGAMFDTPDMPLAFLGLGLLVVVVICSLVAVRRRFSYEFWHLIHLLSYLAVLVAVPHQLSVGGIFAADSPQRLYWLVLYVLAFGAIGGFRFIAPVVMSIRRQMTISQIETIAPGVVSFHFAGRDLESLEVAGGQFFIWRFWSIRTWWHSHPISLSAVPTSTHARITVRDLGSGSRAISSLKPGTRVSFEGPYGRFTDAARTAPRLAIIAAGIGVTPIRAFLEDAAISPGETTILLRASTVDETYLWDEIAELARQKGATVYTMIGSRAHTGPGWMTQSDATRGVSLSSVFPHLADSDLYLCGPSAWVDLITSEATARGVPEHQIHWERFGW